MAPSSAKRRSARKREPRLPAANSSATNSPSRPAKRRKTAPRKSAPTEVAPESGNTLEHSDDETSEDEAANPQTDVVDRIVEILEEAKEPSNVVKEHGNELKSDADHSISAYAKVAGKNWTYFVTDPSINIGRFPDIKPGAEEIAPAPAPDAHPHIDLGPSKHVSRLHAKVLFNSEDENWHLEVVGRNGVRVNEVVCFRKQSTVLHSGDVLKIDSTEMIFVLPSGPVEIHSKYMERLERPQLTAEQRTAGSLTHAHPLAQSFEQPNTYISPYAAPTANGHHPQSDAGSMVAQGQVTPGRATHHGPDYAQHALSSAHKATPQRYQLGGADQLDASQIDYSDDSMRDRKPPMSYATLIAQAILSGPNEKSSLNGIYEWIRTNFAYYRYLEAGWQNSIRHNLSLNPSFQRVGRDTHEPGKGGLWYIAEDKVEEYRKQGLKMTSRGGARQASNPASPVPKRSPKKKTPPPRRKSVGAGSNMQGEEKILSLAESSTAISTGQDGGSQTPPRPTHAGIGLGVQSFPQLSSDASPLPNRAPHLNPNAASGTSPPTLTSSGLFGGDGDTLGASIFTPAPQRLQPRMTAPSTAKLPSKYLPQSSPAPFWKNADHAPVMLGSEISPVKQDPDQTQMLGLQSSSPPPPSVNGSPTRVKSRNSFNASTTTPMDEDDAADLERPAPAAEENKDEDDEDEDQLDLMGNFPKIGEASKALA